MASKAAPTPIIPFPGQRMAAAAAAVGIKACADAEGARDPQATAAQSRPRPRVNRTAAAPAGGASGAAKAGASKAGSGSSGASGASAQRSERSSKRPKRAEDRRRKDPAKVAAALLSRNRVVSRRWHTTRLPLVRAALCASSSPPRSQGHCGVLTSPAPPCCLPPLLQPGQLTRVQRFAYRALVLIGDREGGCGHSGRGTGCSLEAWQASPPS